MLWMLILRLVLATIINLTPIKDFTGLLKAKKANGENDWEKSLPTLILAYNATQHYSSNSSPARIFLGRELNIPYLSLLPKFVQNDNPSPHSVEEQLDYILDLMRASMLEL